MINPMVFHLIGKMYLVNFNKNMKKILILKGKKLNFLQHFFFSKIYTHNEIIDDKVINEANHNEFHKNKKNIKIENISGDFINLQEEFKPENIASKLSEEYISKYFNEIPNYFPDNKSYNFLYWDLNRNFKISKSCLPC